MPMSLHEPLSLDTGVSLHEPLSLHHGDCFEVLLEALRSGTLPPGSVDAIITDPPYGTTNLPWDEAINWPFFWQQARRLLSPSGIVILFSAQPVATDFILSNRAWFRYELIWEKNRATGFLNANKRPLTAHENILIFAPRPRQAPYNPQKTPGVPYKGGSGRSSAHYSDTPKQTLGSADGSRYPRSVLHFDSDRSGSHPSQKPLPLLEWLVQTYTQPGQLVLDPFMGAGTTGVAAFSHGRRFVGIEQEGKYFEVAYWRLGAAVTAPAQAAPQPRQFIAAF